MASVRKRGETFTITAYFGYDEQGRQIKKTTTYRPPDDVTSGKAEKLARAYAGRHGRTRLEVLSRWMRTGLYRNYANGIILLSRRTH